MDKASMSKAERTLVEEFEKLNTDEASFALVLITFRLACDEKTKLDDEQRMDIMMGLLEFYRLACMESQTSFLAKMFKRFPQATWPMLVERTEQKLGSEAIKLSQRCELFADMIAEARKE